MRIQSATQIMLLLLAISIAGCSASRTANLEPAPAPAENPDIAALLRLPMQPEIWVIAQSNSLTSAAPAPTSDILIINDHSLPIHHTEVTASINGFLATTEITEYFDNPIPHNFDATYEFRLSASSTVHDFILTIGNRQIRAVIRPREDAEKIYRDALAQGYSTSLLTQDQSGSFTQKLSNLPARTPIHVKLKYFSTLDYVDGSFQYTFPLANWPSRAISINLHIDPMMPIDDIQSPTDSLDFKNLKNGPIDLTIDGQTRDPHKDFIVQFHPAKNNSQPVLLTEEAGISNYFALMLPPPEIDPKSPRKPLDLTIIVDATTEMDGEKRNLADAVDHQLRANLNSTDTARTIRFPASADLANLLTVSAPPAVGASQRAILIVTGGASINNAVLSVARALDPSTNLAVIQIQDAQYSIFTESLARCGGGIAAKVDNEAEISQTIKPLLEELRTQTFSNLAIDFSPAHITEIANPTNPRIGSQVTLITGTYTGAMPQKISVGANTDGKRIKWKVTPHASAGIESLYAKMKITALADKYLETTDAGLLKQMMQVALDHSIISPLTSLLMVDATAPVK